MKAIAFTSEQFIEAMKEYANKAGLPNGEVGVHISLDSNSQILAVVVRLLEPVK